MKPERPPPPSYAFGYRQPPAAGNAINGLGVTTKMQARHVFHNATGERLAWGALDDFFSMINPWPVVKHILANTWQLRRQDGPVAAQRVEVTDAVAMAAEIKAAVKNMAKNPGTVLIGITRVTDEALYENHSAPFEFAICIGLPMDRDEMQQRRNCAQPSKSCEAIARSPGLRLNSPRKSARWAGRHAHMAIPTVLTSCIFHWRSTPGWDSWASMDRLSVRSMVRIFGWLRS